MERAELRGGSIARLRIEPDPGWTDGRSVLIDK